jgi:hypothetical protein
VRIAGQHLIEASGVEFNGKPATTFQNDGPNFVTATVPAGATSGPISVTTANGRGTTASSFSVQ